MQPYRDPDRAHRPEDDDPNIMPWGRLRAQTHRGLMTGFDSTWRGASALLALVTLVLLVLWELQALGVFH
jgi:hypothetical protein